jgi:hypothetical protein
MRAYKSRSRSRAVLLLSILAIFVISSLSSCMAHRGSGSWDDVGHARSFNHKKAHHDHHSSSKQVVKNNKS